MFCTRNRLTTIILQVKEMDTVHTINNKDMKGTKRERLESCSQEISLDSNRKTCRAILTN